MSLERLCPIPLRPGDLLLTQGRPDVLASFAADAGCMNTRDFNDFGIPVISIPCGFTAKGLPVGIMIAGPHFAEGKVLALAHAYQQATPWRSRTPNLTPQTPLPPIEEKGT